MPELADVTINDIPYMLTPNGYERGAEAPAPLKPGRLSLSTFASGLGWVQGDQIPSGQDGGGWAGQGVHAAMGGAGLEPWPALTSYADPGLTGALLPSRLIQTRALEANGSIFLNTGANLWSTVAVSAAAWANLAVVFAGPATVTDLCYHRDDVMIAYGLPFEIRQWDTATSMGALWRAGHRAGVMQGYGAAVVWNSPSPALKENVYLATTGTDGSATLDYRSVDAQILRLGLFGGSCVIATKTSLYLLSGNARRVAGAGLALWEGELDPLFSHGYAANPAVGDFAFLHSLDGKLYTWLAGGVMRYDPGFSGVDRWTRTGPTGVACRGACVTAGHLVVALETAAGASEVWAFDGAGWWKILSGAVPGYCWPCALGGAGGYDLLVFTHGSGTYTLGRLQRRSTTLHSYASSGTWTSPLLTAGNADATKAWRQVAAFFSWPDAPGNSASADAVTITLEYSVDAGATWTTAQSASVTIGRLHGLELELDPPVTSRLLQLRVSWASVSDLAPVLSRLVVDYASIDTAPRRRRWKLKVAASDKKIRRDSGVLALDGREQIDALFAAWRDQSTVSFRDVDYDAEPVVRTVRVLDIEQTEPKASDAGRWGDGVVTVTLAEL